MNGKKNKVILFFLVLLIAMIIEYVVLKTVIRSDGNSGKSTSYIGEYVNNNSGKKVDINSIDTNVDIGDGNKYTRIGITIKNNNSKSVDIGSYLFQLVDVDGNDIALCSSGAVSANTKMTNILPKELPGNEKVTGYLYCNTDRTDGSKLKISYVSAVNYDSMGMISFDEKVLYINFK